MLPGRVNSPSGSVSAAESGTPIWLRRSVRAVEVVLLRGPGLLAGGPRLDLGQGDVGGLRLVGLEAAVEGLAEVLVEVGQAAATLAFSRR